jgi:hypothetical protein
MKKGKFKRKEDKERKGKRKKKIKKTKREFLKMEKKRQRKERELNPQIQKNYCLANSYLTIRCTLPMPEIGIEPINRLLTR